MPTLNLKMSPQAVQRLHERIARQAGSKIRGIFTDLHTEVLSRTPMNTGRTLASWRAFADSPLMYDAEQDFGEGYFTYDPERFEATNRLAVGDEQGRPYFVNHSLNSAKKIDFERRPYRIFYLTNGAALDSIGDSHYNQGPGSRAYYSEYGRIASYDMYSSTYADPQFNFNPRGRGALRLSVQKISLKYGK